MQPALVTACSLFHQHRPRSASTDSVLVTMSIDYNAIHKHLKQLKLAQNNPASSVNQNVGPAAGITSAATNTPVAQLDEQTAIRYISSLRQDIVQLISASTQFDSRQHHLTSKTLNEIIIFTKTLDFVPKSDKLFSLFDAQLFRSLFEVLCFPDIPVEALRGILRICLTYLAGVLPKTRKQGMFRVLLSVLCEPIVVGNNEPSSSGAGTGTGSGTLRCDLLIVNLTSRITFADARMNLNIVDFIAKVLYRLMETIGSSTHDSVAFVLEEQWLLGVVRSLYVNNFFGVLACIRGIDEIEGMTGLRGSMSLAYHWLKSKKFDAQNSAWIECRQLLKEVGVIFEEQSFLLGNGQNIEMLSILSLIGTLKQPKRSLKKILVECNMTSAFPILQFMSAISSTIAKNVTLDKIFGIWNTDLWFCLLSVSTRCWLASSAKIASGDTDRVISLVRVVIEWLSGQLSTTKYDANGNEIPMLEGISGDLSQTSLQLTTDFDVMALLEKIDNFEYEELRSLQLQMINQQKARYWSSEIKPFENLVHSQVIALVRDQRFLQLSKGAWVYATNPLEQGTKRHYFLTLNSNSQSIVYKEFSKRPVKASQAPNLDKDGIYIDFRNIVNVQAETLNDDIDDSSLINIHSERLDVNRVDVVTKTGIFAFYVDTKQLKDIWVDGLRILIADARSDTRENTPIETAPMQLSLSEQFFAKSAVSSAVRGQVRTLEDIRIRTQMLDLDDNAADSKTADINDTVDWSSVSVNFFYE